MGIIASAQTYIREEDVEYKRSVSENILTKVGASINYILDEAYLTSSPPGVSSEVFTLNGTFTVPTGITKVKVTVVGSGGSGAYIGSGLSPHDIGGFGGGAGGTAIKWVTGLTPGGTVAVTVGAAPGLGGANPGNGVAGNSSSFGAHAVATGGAAGTSGGTNFPLGGVGTTGDILLRGGSGDILVINGNVDIAQGGSSSQGGPGSGATTGAYGAGGNSEIGSPRDGSPGIVIVEWIA